MSALAEISHGTNPVPEFLYTLPDERRSELVRSLIQEAADEGRLPDERIVCFSVDGDDPRANVGRELEVSVFDATFGNTLEVMSAEYQAYDPRSRFYIAVDQRPSDGAEAEPAVVGVLRIIESDPENKVTGGLKSLDDIKEKQLPVPSVPDLREARHIRSLEHAIDAGTVAVRDDYRNRTAEGAMIAMVLYRAFYASARAEGVEHVVAVIDKDAREGLQRVLGRTTLRSVSTSFEYLDSSDSQLVHGRVPDMPRKVTINRDRLIVKAAYAGFAGMVRASLSKIGLGSSEASARYLKQAKRNMLLAGAAHGLRTGKYFDRHMAFSYKS
jgi:hypothetical protein